MEEQADIHDLVIAAQEPEQWDIQPGRWYDGMPDTLYHRFPAASNSGLKLVAQSPAHYRANFLHPKPATAAMEFGRWLHCAVLEPQRFSLEYACAPEDAPKRPTERQIGAKNPSKETLRAIAWWAAWDAEHSGVALIDNTPGKDPYWEPGDWDRLHYIADAVRNHPIAGLLLGTGVAERSYFWRKKVYVRFERDGKTEEVERWEMCKSRVDFMDLAHNTLVDLKSCNDASFSGFARAVTDFRYFCQHPWYVDGAQACGGDQERFCFIAAEKAPPYAVAVYTLDNDAIHLGRSVLKHDLEVYARCMETQEWPAYETNPRQLALPPWAQRLPIS